MRKIITLLLIISCPPLLTGGDAELQPPPELLSTVNACGLVFDKSEIVSIVGTWQLYEANCIMKSRDSLTGDRVEVKFWVYFIKDANSGFSDFCVFKSKASAGKVLDYFRDRWEYLVEGIEKGLINFMEAGGTKASTLGFYFDHGGGWHTEGRNGNLILDRVKAGSLSKYIDEISKELKKTDQPAVSGQ